MGRQGYDQTFYIESLRMRTRIQQVDGDPWTYEFTPKLDCKPEPTDTHVKNQFEFDEVLAGLHLIELDAGRRFVNLFARLTFLEHASALAQRIMAKYQSPAAQQVHRMRRLDAPTK